MSKQTITIMIVMPPDAPATLVIQRGDVAVAHTYTGRIPATHNDRRAIERAYDKLIALEKELGQASDA